MSILDRILERFRRRQSDEAGPTPSYAAGGTRHAERGPTKAPYNFARVQRRRRIASRSRARNRR